MDDFCYTLKTLSAIVLALEKAENLVDNHLEAILALLGPGQFG
jgi:hypothetical protein